MTVHGTARYAEKWELGLNHLVAENGRKPDGLLLGFWFESQYAFEPIRYAGDLHQLIVAGTGGGKFTTALAPMLLGSALENQTVVVVDPKGEIASLLGPVFQTPFATRPNVLLLDPWDQCGTGQTASLNVLSEITADNPNYVDDARALADAMIIPSGAENTHWDNAARNFLTSILLYVALHPDEKGKRDLIRVRDLVTLTWAMPKAYTGPKRPTLSELVFKLLDSELAGGAVKRGFTSLMNREDKERSGIISSIERDTAWIDSPQAAKVLRGNSLDMKEAAVGGNKYFVVLPPEYFMTHRAWLRLMVTAFAKAMKRYRPASSRSGAQRWRHIVIDEFANLGEMSFILNEVAIARGYDVKYHFAVQDLSQLKRVYEDGWESFINNSFQRFFAISDLFTADYVSRMMGSATVTSRTTSFSQNQGTSDSVTEGFSMNRGSSTGSGTAPGSYSSGSAENWSSSFSRSSGWSEGYSLSPTQRTLMTPDEVRRIGSSAQVLFFRGMHPIMAMRWDYWVAFTGLPTFTLKEVLGTIGRRPANAGELARFTNWRQQLRLIQPEALPAPAPMQSLPVPAISAKRRNGWRGQVLPAAMCLMLAAAAWIAWSWYIATPQPPEHRVENPRSPVPSEKAAASLPASAATRDYFFMTMRSQLRYCVDPAADREKQLFGTLWQYAASKPDPTASANLANTARVYNVIMDQYLRQTRWSRADVEDVIELIGWSINQGVFTGTLGQRAAIMDRLFANGNCPDSELSGPLTRVAPIYFEPRYEDLQPAQMPAPANIRWPSPAYERLEAKLRAVK